MDICKWCRKVRNACMCAVALYAVGYGVADFDEDYVRVGSTVIQANGTTGAIDSASGLTAAGPVSWAKGAVTSDSEGNPIFITHESMIVRAQKFGSPPPVA